MAKWRVRTADGELSFTNFLEVEQAYLNNMVGPDDELLEEGATKWRKASSYPLLVQAEKRRTKDSRFFTAQVAEIVIALVLAGVALYLVSRDLLWPALVVGFAASAVMFRITARAFRGKKA